MPLLFRLILERQTYLPQNHKVATYHRIILPNEPVWRKMAARCPKICPKGDSRCRIRSTRRFSKLNPVSLSILFQLGLTAARSGKKRTGSMHRPPSEQHTIYSLLSYKKEDCILYAPERVKSSNNVREPFLFWPTAWAVTEL